MHNHSYETEFNLHVNEISFSYEKISTKTRFEKEATGNSEMAYCVNIISSLQILGQLILVECMKYVKHSRQCFIRISRNYNFHFLEQ